MIGMGDAGRSATLFLTRRDSVRAFSFAEAGLPRDTAGHRSLFRRPGQRLFLCSKVPHDLLRRWPVLTAPLPLII
jgi:hypothetical protein